MRSPHPLLSLRAGTGRETLGRARPDCSTAYDDKDQHRPGRGAKLRVAAVILLHGDGLLRHDPLRVRITPCPLPDRMGAETAVVIKHAVWT